MHITRRDRRLLKILITRCMAYYCGTFHEKKEYEDSDWHEWLEADADQYKKIFTKCSGILQKRGYLTEDDVVNATKQVTGYIDVYNYQTFLK